MICLRLILELLIITLETRTKILRYPEQEPITTERALPSQEQKYGILFHTPWKKSNPLKLSKQNWSHSISLSKQIRKDQLEIRKLMMFEFLTYVINLNGLQVEQRECVYSFFFDVTTVVK